VKKSRPDLVPAAYGKITQGTIFSCAQASRYTNCEVHGVTITARCDVAQQKYPVLNFLPLVQLKDWLRRDGLDILYEQELNERAGKLKGMLRKENLSEALPASISLDEISKVHFPLDEGTTAKKASSKKFWEFLVECNEFDEVDRQDDPDLMFMWFATNRASKVEEIIRRLSRHAVLGHYFLETLSGEASGAQGYVCLLREVATLPKRVAEKLGKGLDSESYKEICGDSSRSLGLVFEADNLAMPVVQIGSPTMEHILQSFGSLFGRIGVEDPVEDVISGIIVKSMAR
jgi:hypothetical protein